MDAIAIEVNGTFLDLQESSLRLETINSVFESETFQGDYSFPFDIPCSKTNLTALGYPSYADVQRDNNTFLAQLYIYGIPKYSALKLTVTRANEKRISIVLNGGVKALNNADKKLSELNWPADVVLGNTGSSVADKALTITKVNSWQPYGFVFVPFKAPNFYNGKNPFWCEICNRMDSVTGKYLLNVSANAYNLVPWMYLKFVLNKIFEENNLKPEGSFWNDAELSTLLLFGNKSIDVRGDNFNTLVKQNWTLPGTAYNTTGQVVGLDLGPAGSFDNAFAWNNATDEYIVPMAGDYKFAFMFNVLLDNTATIKPPYLSGGHFEVWFDGTKYKEVEIDWQKSWDVEEQIGFLNFGLILSAGDIGKAIQFKYRRDVNFTQAATVVHLREAFFSVSINEGSTISKPASRVSYRDLVPDITVGDLLLKLSGLGITYNFDKQGVVSLNIISERITNGSAIDLQRLAGKPNDIDYSVTGKGYSLFYNIPTDENPTVELNNALYEGEVLNVSDLPDSPIEGKWRIVSSTNEVYKGVVDGSGVTSWEMAGYNYNAHKVGTGESEVVCDVLPLQMVTALNENGTTDENTAIMPVYNGVGSTDLYGIGKTVAPLRFAFYRGENRPGVNATQRGGKYIYAGTMNIGVNGNPVGAYTFRLDNSGNIVRQCKESLLSKIDNNPVVEFSVDLTPNVLEETSSCSKYLIDNNVYLLKAMSVFIKKSIAQATFYGLKI
jgi:hypothetical protein